MNEKEKTRKTSNSFMNEVRQVSEKKKLQTKGLRK